ncbi:hypothetical protein EYF80_026209 [Liparis tanakae]|uniref:Uncharacterized protein n=1 Tax=Liparis tanakae TaxID=230148 RepID=A0A4Z2HCE4_9TELE|nr:hypothetical protein EYF80_026209 [Liparis tanakae]
MMRGRPDVEEGLKSALGRLGLGQLLAATAALEYTAVHAHRHHEATQPPALGSLRKAGVAQARPQLVQGVAEQPPVSQELAGQQLALCCRVAEREAVGARRGVKLLEERVGEVRLIRGALGNWTKDLRASSAAFIFAFFFVGPVPSNVSPFTSTAMEKTGAWTGPVWDTMRYCRPGRSSLSCTKAFFGDSDQDSFL